VGKILQHGGGESCLTENKQKKTRAGEGEYLGGDLGVLEKPRRDEEGLREWKGLKVWS